jgi:hypothetical protein
MQSHAATVPDYLASLPDDRRAAVETVLAVVRQHLDPKFEEGMTYGMIGWYVPHSVYPPGYHCDPKQPLPFAALASQKNYLSLYLMGLYSDPDQARWFEAEWAKTGKKLDMGKSCIRFRGADGLALDVIAKALKRMTVKRYVAAYEAQLASAGQRAKR